MLPVHELIYLTDGSMLFHGRIITHVMQEDKATRWAILDAIHNLPAVMDADITIMGGPDAAVMLRGSNYGGHGFSVVHLSSRGDGWQHSWFGSDGEAHGHTVCATRREAIKDALDFGRRFIVEVA